MRGFNQIRWGVTGAIMFLWPFISWGDATTKSASLFHMDLTDYVKLVLKQGDRAVIAHNNFENQTLSYRVSYRQSRLPTLSLSSDLNKSKSDVDASVTRTESASGAATVTQPVYLTGGRLSATYTQDSSNYESGISTVTHSFTRPSLSLTFNQPIFLFVGNQEWRAWRRNALSYEIASDTYKRDLQSIELEAKTRYFDVLLKKARVEVERAKFESAKRSNRITNALVKAGRLARIELSRSNLRLDQDQRRVQNAEKDARQAELEALQFASLPMETQAVFTSRLDYAPLTLTEEALTSYALKNRPDFIAAKKQLDLSELNVKEVREANNPTLSAVASVSRAETGSTGQSDSLSRQWSGGINMTWPIFDSRITALRVTSAKNSLENDRVSLRGVERAIRTEVANAYLDVKNNEIQLEDLKNSIRQARQSVDSVRIRYQNGRDRLIDVFDSENELRSLELENLNVIVNANLAKDRLALIVGGSLDEVPQ